MCVLFGAERKKSAQAPHRTPHPLIRPLRRYLPLAIKKNTVACGCPGEA
jgi:hypothetical protein